MSEYSWNLIREQAIEAWGSIPQGQLEADIIEVFMLQPALVVAMIEKVTVRYKEGRIRSPWAILRLELQGSSRPDGDPVVSDGRERDKAVGRAEQWMRAAGQMFDRWSEAEDELFGDRGQLRAWRSDQALVERMRGLWESLRPTGAQIEADELERAERWKSSRAAILALPKVPVRPKAKELA